MPAPSARRRLAWVLLCLFPAFFSVNMLAARYALFVPPNALALGRWAFVALFLLPFVWPRLRAGMPTLRREWRDLLLSGALGMWVCGAFVYIGAHSTSALNIGLIYAASPILVVLLDHVIDRKGLSATRIAGIVLCLGGVATVFAKGEFGNLAAVHLSSGDVWIAIAAACWGLYSVLLKHRPSRLDPVARLCATSIAGCLVLLPFALGEAALWGGPDLGDWHVWAVWLVVALVPGIGAYAAYSFCIQELGPAPTSVSLYLGPPYVGVLAWLTLGERPQWYHLLGIVLVLPGLFLVTRQPRSIKGA
ncbi:MAG: DMT family transporter [Proteobacteria bacterium]|nr:DMT family transporter [Pseudomonadota bacterium]